MTSRELCRFFQRPDAVAARVRRRRLPWPAVPVPRGTFGYVASADRRRGDVLSPGERLRPARRSPAWVFREGPWDVAIEWKNLRSREGIALDARWTMSLQIPPRSVDVRLFLGIDGLGERVTAEDLRAILEPPLRRSFGQRIRSLGVEAMMSEMGPDDWRDRFRESGEEVLFERGLALCDLRIDRIDAPVYDELRKEHVRVQIEEERARQRIRRIEIWKREQMELERARRDIESCGGPAPSGPRPEGAAEAAAGEAPSASGAGFARPSLFRCLCCAGSAVYAARPGEDARARLLHRLGDGELGLLRSVRSARAEDGRELILAGAQRGVYAIDRAAGEREGYPLPRAPEAGGGVNSILLCAGRLYATHSEIGLVEWPLGQPSSPRIIFDAREEGASSVRAVQAGPDGAGYFAAGGEIRAFELDGSARMLESWKAAGDEVTSFAAGHGEVAAGTRSGRLVLWRRGSAPRSVIQLGSHAVYGVRAVFRGGRVLYAVGARNCWVTVLDPDAGGEQVMRASRPVQWVDACQEFVCGVEQGEGALLIWSWEHRRSPSITLRFPERIRDLWIERVAAASDECPPA
ncbi:MAG: hypothetical protein JXA90_03245 [Planctomycetes bacterium]|nr:hypothetical protein [Planctomycetota bacterium]